MNSNVTSKSNTLSLDLNIYSKIDNTFRSCELWPDSMYDQVVLKHQNIPDKFWSILIKEMFYLVAPKGELILQVDKAQTVRESWQLRQRFFNLLVPIADYQTCQSEAGTIHRVVKAELDEVGTNAPDDIDCWSFGIVTNGDRDSWVIDFVLSVAEQNIPKYEIIVCGQVDTLKSNEIIAKFHSFGILKFIDFNSYSERGWITKKKNLIAHSAKYGNMAIFHDRYQLDKNWFCGMKKYGNNFEVLGCVNINEDGLRSDDWCKYPENILDATLSKGWLANKRKIFQSFPILMDYRDWDSNVFIPGGMIIIKKAIWQRVMWNERLYWNEQEDVWLSHMQCFYGIINRFNIHSKVIVRMPRGNNKITIKYFPTKRGWPTPILRYALSFCKRVILRILK